MKKSKARKIAIVLVLLLGAVFGLLGSDFAFAVDPIMIVETTRRFPGQPSVWGSLRTETMEEGDRPVFRLRSLPDGEIDLFFRLEWPANEKGGPSQSAWALPARQASRTTVGCFLVSADTAAFSGTIGSTATPTTKVTVKCNAGGLGVAALHKVPLRFELPNQAPDLWDVEVQLLLARQTNY
ncbi:MAG: hypothetical protein LBJ38_03775 [Oscillospiraceae bacterium]|jgi:hypothetical protein|nr:hypothetical protein [Oscillospiraceae bacterium]